MPQFTLELQEFQLIIINWGAEAWERGVGLVGVEGFVVGFAAGVSCGGLRFGCPVRGSEEMDRGGSRVAEI